MPPDPATISHVIGRRIASARRAAGLTQGELAARLDWPRDTLIHYEHGRRTLNVERLVLVAAALDMSPALLLIDDPDVSDLAARLTADPALVRQVRFFLSTLEESRDEPPLVAG